VFLAIEMNQAQAASTIPSSLARLALALCTIFTILRNSPTSRPVSPGASL